MFERIPKELKENALFCLYKLEQLKGKQTKVPYQVRGARADPSNPKCFANFNTVVSAYKKGGYQLQRTVDMRYIIETTKTEAGKRKIPITEEVAMMFQAIIEDREPPKTEKVIDGYTGFLFYDNDGNPLVAMHWQHRFNNMVGRYNDIYRVQMPNITPHVCRHTYCSNMAKSGMNPKTLQYLMGHSDTSVTMNVYTHIGFDDAEEELKRMEEFRKALAEVDKGKEGKAVSQKMFKVV